MKDLDDKLSDDDKNDLNDALEKLKKQMSHQLLMT